MNKLYTIVYGFLVIVALVIIIEITNVKDKKATRVITTSTTLITPTTTTQKTTTKVNIHKKKKTSKKALKEDKEAYKKYAYELVISNGWSEEDYNSLVKLWNRESGWSIYARNKTCLGIPQSCPGSKMKKFGGDYKTNYKTQIKWGLNYIKSRYGSPSNAWKHSQSKGWY